MKKLIVLLFLVLSVNLFSQDRYILKVKEAYFIENANMSNEKITEKKNINHLLIEFYDDECTLTLMCNDVDWSETFPQKLDARDGALFWKNGDVLLKLATDSVAILNTKTRKMIVLIL